MHVTSYDIGYRLVPVLYFIFYTINTGAILSLSGVDLTSKIVTIFVWSGFHLKDHRCTLCLHLLPHNSNIDNRDARWPGMMWCTTKLTTKLRYRARERSTDRQR